MLPTAQPHTVVMTACLRPEAQFAGQLRRVDPAIREQDYLAGLDFWLQLPDPRITRIIFIENTLAPLEALAAHVRNRNPRGRECEFISIDCNRTPPGLHYGYAEYRLMDEGLARSRLYAASSHLIKATGRYRFPGITRLLDSLPADYRVAADARDNRRFVPKPQTMITAPLFLSTREFYEAHLRRVYQRMRPPPPWWGQFIEDALYEELMPLRGQPGVILRWKVNCDPAGIGANGDHYRNARKRLLSTARAVGRKLLPDWWF